jgi:hypothetical protein
MRPENHYARYDSYRVEKIIWHRHDRFQRVLFKQALFYLCAPPILVESAPHWNNGNHNAVLLDGR